MDNANHSNERLSSVDWLGISRLYSLPIRAPLLFFWCFNRRAIKKRRREEKEKEEKRRKKKKKEGEKGGEKKGKKFISLFLISMKVFA